MRVLAIIRIDTEDDVVVLISLSKKDTLPYEITHTAFQIEIESSSFVLQQGYDPVVCINPTEKQLEAAEKSWDIIGDFVSDEPDCFDAKIRSRFIAAKTKETGVQRRQITRLLYRYWAGGMSKHALYPQNSNKGGPGKSRTYAQQPGRKVRFEDDNQRMTIGDAELALIQKYMNKYYNKHTKYQYRYVYQKMILDCYTDPLTGALAPSYPTENQFRYHASKYVDVKKRFGSTAYRKDMRGIIIHFILRHNSTFKAKHPQPIPEVIHSGVPAIPLELWNWGIQNRTGVLRQMGSQDLQVALSQRGQATVTRHGIRLHTVL